MMIALRLIGSEYNIDPRFLDASDVPFILIGIICLFVAYYKVKKLKLEHGSEKISNEVDSPLDLESYDILMQPTKNKNDFHLPFINYSMPKISLKDFLLGVALLIFYYLILTEKI